MCTEFFRKFLPDQDGAVTVDWVVLTAVIVTLGIVVVSVISPALNSTATEIAVSIDQVIT